MINKKILFLIGIFLILFSFPVLSIDYITSVEITQLDATTTINDNFSMSFQYTCDGFNCQNVFRTIELSSSNCTLQSPDTLIKNVGNMTSYQTLSETVYFICTVPETININISLNSSSNVTVTTSGSISVQPSSVLTADEKSCMFTGKYVNGTNCAVGLAQAGLNMIGILGTLIIFMALFFVLYFYSDSIKDYMGGTNIVGFLKPSFFILGISMSFLILFVLGELASSYGIASNIVTLLRVLLLPYGLFVLVLIFFILWGFTVQLSNFNKAGREGRL